MNAALTRYAGGFLRLTRLAWFPVKVRRGIARGDWWTLYPFSAYWRGGVEMEMQEAIADLGDFTGKVCVVTGGTQGVGAAAAREPAATQRHAGGRAHAGLPRGR
mgnify:CR=1 FL=1